MSQLTLATCRLSILYTVSYALKIMKGFMGVRPARGKDESVPAVRIGKKRREGVRNEAAITERIAILSKLAHPREPALTTPEVEQPKQSSRGKTE